MRMRLAGLPEPTMEYSFAAPERKWRWDMAYPDIKLAIEVDGGTWSGGRHTSGSGFSKDCEKHNAGVLRGWALLRFTTDMVTHGVRNRFPPPEEVIKEAIEKRRNE